MALASLSLSSSLVNRMHLYVLLIDRFALLLLNCGQKIPLVAIGELTRARFIGNLQKARRRPRPIGRVNGSC